MALALLGCLAAVLGPAAAPASAATRLEVAAGWSGFGVPGRAVPVRVTVTADRLLRGDLLARDERADREAVRFPVEVAGGSVKRFVLLLPPSAADENDTKVQVELRSGGQVLARGVAPLLPATNAELVGLLPGALAGRPVPAAAPLAVDAGLARFAALDPADAARGPFALDALSTVGAAHDEIAALAPSARAGLLAWVAAGGRLLIDGPAAEAVPGLPDDWTPGPNGRAPAGRGEIRLTGDAMATGRWAGLVEPTPLGRNIRESFFSGDTVANSVAVDAGLRLPRLTTLLGFLGAYVVAVGPLTAVVLRRRRRPELAWVVVPGLAVAFTVVSYAAGSSARGGIHMAHGSVVETQGESGMVTTFVGVSRSGSDAARVGFPAGWTVRPALGDTSRSSLPVVAQADAGPEAEVGLDLGQFGFVRASGPTSLPGALQLTAAADGGDASGTVRNRLPYALEEVTVLLGTGAAQVGRLGPGEERTWTISQPFSQAGQPFGQEWFRRFPGEGFSEGRLSPDGPVNLALWDVARADLGTGLSAPGSAVAVGWTRSFHPDVRLDGKARRVAGRTALLARAPVTAPAGSVPAAAVRREVLRGPFPSEFGWTGRTGPEDATVLRFTLPTGRDATRPLVLRSNLTLQNVEVWREGVWQQVGPLGAFPAVAVPGVKDGFVPRFAPGPMPPPVPVPLPPTAATAPPGAALPVPVPTTFPIDAGGVLSSGGELPIPEGGVSDGVVFLRVRGNFFESGGGIILTLGEAS